MRVEGTCNELDLLLRKQQQFRKPNDMVVFTRLRHFLAIIAAVAFLACGPIFVLKVSPAHAQASVSVEFERALEPYGEWQHHSRWGEVWVPANVSNEWRPYTVGRWVYTDDWGWYWIEGSPEAAWGWITFHYGRWLFDHGVWVWVPGTEWGPGWVNWRYSGASVSRTAS